jgi:hypothetical protein
MVESGQRVGSQNDEIAVVFSTASDKVMDNRTSTFFNSRNAMNFPKYYHLPEEKMRSLVFSILSPSASNHRSGLNISASSP